MIGIRLNLANISFIVRSNMEEKGIHYRNGSKITHAGCEMLPNGNDIPYIVIEKIEFKESEEIGGRKESGVWIATFAQNPYTKLPMVLNATNKKRIAKLARNEMINLIKNLPVRLTKEECKDAQDGGTTWGLRISKLPPTIPAPPKKTLLTEDKLESAKKFLETKSMAELEGFYEIPEDMRLKLAEK